MHALGIDTSNYTTSAAVYDARNNRVYQEKKLLPVKTGELGLRQSDAVFAHVGQLGAMLSQLMQQEAVSAINGIGVSVRPRDKEGSYMPCFLVGELAADSIAAVNRVPVYKFSHQAGHIAAALFSAGKLDFTQKIFAAFHLSGGTTECVLVRPDRETIFDVRLIAQSLDLKAGQAVDRVGRMLGLPFPAGPELERLALRSGRKFKVKASAKGMDCSLSGIENQCRAMLDREEPSEDIARFCLESILVAVLHMTREVQREFGNIPIVYSGGVMSNGILQEALYTQSGGYFARPEFSSDNAVGVAVLAAIRQGESISGI